MNCYDIRPSSGPSKFSIVYYTPASSEWKDTPAFEEGVMSYLNQCDADQGPHMWDGNAAHKLKALLKVRSDIGQSQESSEGSNLPQHEWIKYPRQSYLDLKNQRYPFCHLGYAKAGGGENGCLFLWTGIWSFLPSFQSSPCTKGGTAPNKLRVTVLESSTP